MSSSTVIAARSPRRYLPTLAVVAYTFTAWGGGVWMLTLQGPASNLLGVLLTSHALVYSAYLIHDCAHQALFRTGAANDRLGIAMSWLNGACVANYARLRKKHLRHHTDRVDVVTFDYRAALRRLPRWARNVILALEWAYIPAVELLMRGMVIAAPFSRREAGRSRVVVVLLTRLSFFVVLALVSPKAILLYALAFLIFLTVLRFLDAFQHTYEVFASPSLDAVPADPRRDLRYEYENTYSNLLTARWGWLNVLVLNFPYHNAHHVRPSLPWFRLPALHRSLYGTGDPQTITCRALARSYHRHRLTRVLADHYGSVAAEGDRASGFVGAVGVSFLTAV